ncbi:hypothetical protein CJ030_MR8G020759 [Morella rubra]|uniref:Uncharacterized protein n=1 Tax=Morella rubra TaxID=262757 RepID=A0A6A1UXU6_9ROSI|nr:hypothetical protein CJ030_MR8G020759 [Morella rubra]
MAQLLSRGTIHACIRFFDPNLAPSLDIYFALLVSSSTPPLIPPFVSFRNPPQKNTRNSTQNLSPAASFHVSVIGGGVKFSREISNVALIKTQFEISSIDRGVGKSQNGGGADEAIDVVVVWSAKETRGPRGWKSHLRQRTPPSLTTRELTNMDLDIVQGFYTKHYKKHERLSDCGLGLHRDAQYLMIRVTDSRVLKLLSRFLLLALFIVSFPSIVRGFFTSSPGTAKAEGGADLIAPELLPLVLHDLKNEGLLKDEKKYVFLSNANEEKASVLHIVRDNMEIDLIPVTDLERLNSIQSETFDFAWDLTSLLPRISSTELSRLKVFLLLNSETVHRWHFRSRSTMKSSISGGSSGLTRPL